MYVGTYSYIGNVRKEMIFISENNKSMHRITKDENLDEEMYYGEYNSQQAGQIMIDYHKRQIDIINEVYFKPINI